MTNVAAKADAAEILARVMGQDYAQVYLGDTSWDSVRTERETIRRARMAEAARVAAEKREKTRRENGGAVSVRKARRERGESVPQKRVDRGRIVELYRGGTGVMAIARELDAHRSTVSRVLKEELGSLYVPPVKKKLTECSRGHDMAVHGKPTGGARGGRYCSECKRMRERVGSKK